jgi:hypothetical protein
MTYRLAQRRSSPVPHDSECAVGIDLHGILLLYQRSADRDPKTSQEARDANFLPQPSGTRRSEHLPCDWRETRRLVLAPKLGSTPTYIRPLPPPPFDFFLLSFLHTYLVWVAAIKKAVHHGLVPALHSAAEQSVQRPSGH